MAVSTLNAPVPRKLGGGARKAVAHVWRAPARAARALNPARISLDARLAVAYVGGIAVTAIGVALIYMPAGIIVAGASSVASAIAYARHAPAPPQPARPRPVYDASDELESPSLAEVS